MRKFLVLFLLAFLLGCDIGTDPVSDQSADPKTQTVTETPADQPDPATAPTEVTVTQTPVPSAYPIVETPTTVVEARPVWVMNSNWEIVRTDTLKASVRYAREINSLESLNEEIAAHNLAHPENPWTLYIDTVPSIEDAPMCEIWIVDPVTYALKNQPGSTELYHLLAPRVDVIPRRYAWEADAAAVGGKLYVDYPPPAEIPAPVYDAAYWYAYYSIYVIGSTGIIHFEIHITEEDFVSQGYISRDQMFERNLTGANLIAAYDSMGQPDAPWRVISGKVYVQPE